MDAWYVLCTRPAKEQSTTEELSHLVDAYILSEAFCPLERVKDNARHVRIKPFFKRYIFALGDLKDGDVLAAVKRTRGLYYIPSISGKMLVVAPAEITYLKSLHEADGYISLQHSEFIPNKSLIEITDQESLFFQQQGIYQKHLNNSTRIRILLENAYSCTLEFDEHDVRIVN